MAVLAALPELLAGAGEAAGAAGAAEGAAGAAEGGAAGGGRIGNFINGAKRLLPNSSGNGGGQTQKVNTSSIVNNAGSVVRNAESSF